MIQPIDTRPATQARRIEAQRRTRLLGSGWPMYFTSRAVEALAKLDAVEPIEREYTIEALTLALRCSAAKILRMVRLGLLPRPSRVIDNRCFWKGSEIEPVLVRRGSTPPAVEQDEALAQLREERAAEPKRLSKSERMKAYRERCTAPK